MKYPPLPEFSFGYFFSHFVRKFPLDCDYQWVVLIPPNTTRSAQLIGDVSHHIEFLSKEEENEGTLFSGPRPRAGSAPTFGPVRRPGAAGQAAVGLPGCLGARVQSTELAS